MIYFISGHLDVSIQEFMDHYLIPIQRGQVLGDSFVVGDARGLDLLAQEFLRGSNKVTVYHMFESPRNNYGGYATVGGFKSDSERDEAMTAVSDEDIAWVRPGREKSGTAKNLARRLRL
jgi:hypothetical protein